MPQLLLELFSEEIPARMQVQAARDLERMVRERLLEHGLLPEAVQTYSGPRRLTLVADGLPPAQKDRSEERKGPRANAPEQALQGFLRSTGLSRNELLERDGVFYATIHKAGRPTPEIIAEVVEGVIRAFPWPKSMRSGTRALRWVRPLQRILCTFDGEVVPFSVDGVEAGHFTQGHRFMGSRGRPFRCNKFEAYAAGLEREFVVLDPEERKARILDGARTLCFARGLELVDDQGLLDEVAGLAEWPTPILGDMDPAFLDLPPEVIRTSMRTHQKYFAVRGAGATGLAPHFITVANIDAPDGGATIAAGNAKVLSARLSDARYFWDEDRRVPLEERLQKLAGVTFHAKLGTMQQRVERIVELARTIAPLVGADVELSVTAARLCKADLASAMVGEFPELQGVMGGYYARMEPYAASAAAMQGISPGREGFEDGQEDPLATIDIVVEANRPDTGGWHSGLAREQVDTVADAVRDHYKPQGPGDAVSRAPVTNAVALADKLDTLISFFTIDEKPTGSRDPYALRRAALGVIRIVLENGARIRLGEIFTAGASGQGAAPADDLLAFFADRLKVLLREQGRRHDLVDAVFALGDDDLVRIVARVEALSAFLSTENGADLLAGYRRAVNILRAEAKKGGLPEGAWVFHPTAAAEEQALAAALAAAQTELEPKLGVEDFAGAMASLAALRDPVDAFFDRVLVNDPDPAVRAARLRLLGQVRDAMDRVADFGQVTG